MSRYCIGIDTGGTFTDAVLLDTASQEVIHHAKERTTHHDLSIGVGRALGRLLRQGISTDAISRLAVSTTLATNAVVEGHGARVALFVLGYVRHFKLPVVANIFLKGGHTITGEEDEPLDLEGIIDTLEGLQDEVDSYAVCGAMSIQNPAHELVTEKAISMIDPKPVYCSHRVSSHPGIKERSATACLHAKLKPLMSDFLNSIQRSMNELGLHCPVTIICGDGSSASLEETVERSALTMASGPAATARFGARGDQQTALVVDVGGTTTDICLIKDGSPVMSSEGCRIGRWQTHVDAVDMYTAAGGGDSHVNCDQQGQVTLHATRVQPLAMTPGLPEPTEWLHSRNDSYLALPVERTGEESANDPIVQHLLAAGPTTPSALAAATGIQGIALEKRLERLAYLQQVTLAGFTPTDALHALGQLEIGNRTASEQGAVALAAELGRSSQDFCLQVVHAASQAIENIILTYLARTAWSPEQATMLLNRRSNPFFSVNFAVNLPIIGIGAAAQYFLPEIARRLQTTVSFPEHFEVGNAIGAALIGMEQPQA
ncbi:hydantoinase/oxoprolinase N-terminal domain-containing protein [Desulfogranum mediterraneum]|uniref:hydantoinase/oxoprolinase N-terminal domain-containing protein n=1 Tax=Desulfogranum mediterraneum TaxID=160661 RepID=UPI0004064324|nr:hydantoinase/oxoprolinase family protein [Desulfogranum mediterraneum]